MIGLTVYILQVKGELPKKAEQASRQAQQQADELAKQAKPTADKAARQVQVNIWWKSRVFVIFVARIIETTTPPSLTQASTLYKFLGFLHLRSFMYQELRMLSDAGL